MTEMAYPILLADPVVAHAGHQHLRRRDGSLQPLLNGPGLPVEHFVPGWTPGVLFGGAAPFLILEFHGPGGARAAWLLDAGLCRLGDRLDELQADHLASLRHAILPVLRRMATDILLRPVPIFSREARAFAQLNDAFREGLADLAADDVLRAPQILLVNEMPDRMPFDGAMQHADVAVASEVQLQRAHIAEGLAAAFEDRILAATHDGMLSFPSPVDGRRLRCQGSLYLDDFRIAYRFADIAAGLAFYVIASDHYVKAVALYVPAIDLLVVPDSWSRHLLGVYFSPGVERRLVRHALSFGARLVPYLVRGAARLASVLRGAPGTHLGHQLWNELSGIEYLLGSRPGALIPEWIVPGPRHAIELWGATDLVFPELRHRVNRAFACGGDVLPYLYSEGVCAVRMTRERVSARLRRRLQRITRSGAAFAAAERLAEASHRNAAAVIVLGLRVENRTMVDITQFFADAIAMIAQRWPGSTVVIDGHNSWHADAAQGAGVGQTIRSHPIQSQSIQSHGEWMAATPPLQVERAIAAELRAAACRLDVCIVDTLGAPLSHSLAWAQLCDGFLSIWGASLAKFRWVCNKPGLVVSSRANLLHRDDLHIYDAPRYMELPTPLLFADPAAIEDDAQAARLVPVAEDEPLFANFRADHGLVLAQFAGLIEQQLATLRCASVADATLRCASVVAIG
ncbi:hypothetical protein [Lichenicoccus sp.]|uniref:hypothetical protein n=1 Tax=Lichenicoccus sp. TaxID=2781899 RepID=UPI003D0B8432